MRILRATAGAIALVLALSGVVAAGDLTLHPSGFGEHSYAAWKAGEGLPDSTGNKNQALYFQKMTDTTVNAAGVAVFKGFEGISTSALTGLSFWVRDDGWCGAGAPRFNIRVQPLVGPRQTIFVGCQGMLPGPSLVAPNGHVFTKRTATSPAIVVPGTIVSLSIVFDEGTTNMGLPLGPGFTYLDDITVVVNGTPHTWTSASDNGNGGTTAANTTLSASELEAALGEPLSTLLR